MFTFGFSSPVDFLSWGIVGLLGLKVAATIVLLLRDKRTWFDHRWSAALWWSTKVVPLLVVPGVIAIARLQHDMASVWLFSGVLIFVLIAVPVMVWRRFWRGQGGLIR